MASQENERRSPSSYTRYHKLAHPKTKPYLGTNQNKHLRLIPSHPCLHLNLEDPLFEAVLTITLNTANGLVCNKKKDWGS